MSDQPTGLPTALQSPERSPDRKLCSACQQVKPRTDFAATSGGPSASCRGCRRAVSRLASGRRAAAMRLLIAAQPEEWAGLLGLVRGRRQLGTTRAKGRGHDAA
jgi:hypothetical protein